MEQKYDVAAYIWPAYTGDEPRTRIFWEKGIGEWQSVMTAEKKARRHCPGRRRGRPSSCVGVRGETVWKRVRVSQSVKAGVICISEVVDILLAVLIPACDLSSPTFLMMYCAYMLTKQGDNIQP